VAALPGQGGTAPLSLVPSYFGELRLGEVRAEGRAGKARNWSERGNRTGGYSSSSTNSSTGTPYALAIFVTVGK
jgi:hypothetical protein